MTYDTDITIQTTKEIYRKADAIIDSLGLDMNVAVNIFLRQVIMHNGMPFSVILNDQEEEDEDEAGNSLSWSAFHGHFNSVEEMINSLY